jgi:predicted aspartyl protease
LKFSYKKLANGLIRPIIPIELRLGGHIARYEVLIDSGADISILNAEIADMLGVDMKSGRPGMFVGVTGVPEQSYIHKVTIVVGGNASTIEVMFAEKVGQDGYGVLGQRGFFENFKVKFDYRKEQLEITPQP